MGSRHAVARRTRTYADCKAKLQETNAVAAPGRLAPKGAKLAPEALPKNSPALQCWINRMHEAHRGKNA